MDMYRPDSWDHPDLPALTVARLVLNALEGLLWKSIRGAGLAYGASIMADVERGQLSFRVSWLQSVPEALLTD